MGNWWQRPNEYFLRGLNVETLFKLYFKISWDWGHVLERICGMDTWDWITWAMSISKSPILTDLSILEI